MASNNIDRLIFGCGRLSGGIDKKQSSRLLNAAYDLGIRRFDLAPSYGDGQVEKILADALGARMCNVQLTTKVGLVRPIASPIKSTMRALIRPIATRAVRAFNKQPAKIVFSNSVGNMDVSFLRSSFEDSLRRLKVDSIDALLLHEPRSETISDDAINFLNSLKSSGVINRFGTGTGQDYKGVVHIGEILQFKYSGDFEVNSNIETRIHGLFRGKDATSVDEACRVVKGIFCSGSKCSVVFSTRNIENIKLVANKLV